jgi:hypothetical protein
VSSEFALKFGAAVTTLVVMFSSYAYASTHTKNPNAPLQPPVEKLPEAVQATPTPTPIPSLVGTRRGNPPRGTSSPAPRLTLQPGVQATDLPEVTFTHTS